MAYSTSDKLIVGNKLVKLVDGTNDVVLSNSDIEAVAYTDSPTLSEGYPGYRFDPAQSPKDSPLTDFYAAGFLGGDHVLVSGFTTGANNGVFRVQNVITADSPHSSEMQVTGGNSDGIVAEVAGDLTLFRKVRVLKVANLQSSGNTRPIGFHASTITNLAGAELRISLNDGKSWDAVPGIVLPDTQQSPGDLFVQATLPYETLFYFFTPSDYTGTIYAG